MHLRAKSGLALGECQSLWSTIICVVIFFYKYKWKTEQVRKATTGLTQHVQLWKSSRRKYSSTSDQS